mmetsp:Transcript_27867/g.72955  ORF Transcript_27867/g.72955 Transcript_27867/m.72955 type:complete len:593 (+) Transcript_27867:111-1889(+)
MAGPSEAAPTNPMSGASLKPVWYRLYVLFILLLLSTWNLATRNLPSYLVTVPVPECESVCEGIAYHPLCGKNAVDTFPRGTPTRYQLCQLCRARVVPTPPQQGPPAAMIAAEQVASGAADTKGASLSVDGPGAWANSRRMQVKFGVASSQLQLRAQDDPQILVTGGTPTKVSYGDVMEDVPWSDSWGQDASFYNMADGACLYQWEYGILIGFGFTLVFGAGSLFAGWVCDRRSRVVVASASLMVMSVATALQASAHSFLYLLVFRAIIGLAQAFAMPAAISILSDYFVEKQKVAVGVLSVGLYLGSGCASFSLLFAMALGWRWAVLLAGLVGIALAPVLYHTVKEPERTIFNAPCNLQVVVDEVFEKSRVARMLTVAASCKMVATYSLSAFLPIWYSRRGLTGYSAYSYACWNAVVISSGGVLSALMGDLVGTRWAQRDSRAPCWIGLIGSVTAIPLVCVMLFAWHFGVSMLAFFLFLFASESWFGPTVSLYQASVRRSVRGQAVSLFLIASSLVGNIGPALVGFFDPGGERIGLHLLWICITANLGAAFAFVWTAREISVDPVAAGFHDQKEDNLQESLGTKAGTAHWATF